MKTCAKCRNEFPATLEYWHKNKYRKDGLNYYCKPCTRAKANLNNKTMLLDPVTNELVSRGTLNSRKRYRNPVVYASILAKNKVAQRARWASGKTQAYLDASPIAKLRKSLSVLIYSSMKAKGWSKATKTQALVGCDFDFLLSHLKSTLPDYEKHDVIHIDHILPCSSAENEDELNALQHWSNLQWLPGPENLSKSSALPNDWQARKVKLMEIYWSRTVAK